jgi:hypothetical protein
MRLKYGGPMPLQDLYQAFIQDKLLLARHHIQHVRAAAVYFTPCDQQGRPVLIRDEFGNEIRSFECDSAYFSAADAYERALREPQSLESHPVLYPVTRLEF